MGVSQSHAMTLRVTEYSRPTHYRTIVHGTGTIMKLELGHSSSFFRDQNHLFRLVLPLLNVRYTLTGSLQPLRDIFPMLNLSLFHERDHDAIEFLFIFVGESGHEQTVQRERLPEDLRIVLNCESKRAPMIRGIYEERNANVSL